MLIWQLMSNSLPYPRHSKILDYHSFAGEKFNEYASSFSARSFTSCSRSNHLFWEEAALAFIHSLSLYSLYKLECMGHESRTPGLLYN